MDFQATDRLSFRIGRTFLPLGFDWEEAGSMTAKDATRVQRINSEANFGVMLSARGGHRRDVRHCGKRSSEHYRRANRPRVTYVLSVSVASVAFFTS